MFYYTTRQIADLMNIHIGVVRYHIKIGNLKANRNDKNEYVIENHSYIDFQDFYTSYNWKDTGIQKIPSVKDFNDNPNSFNDETKIKIQRDKSILKDRFINKMAFNDISIKYGLKKVTIRQIVNRNKDDF